MRRESARIGLIPHLKEAKVEAFFVLLRLLAAIYGVDFECHPVDIGQVCAARDRESGLRVDWGGAKVVVVSGLPGATSDIKLELYGSNWQVRSGGWKVKNADSGRMNKVRAVNVTNRAVRLSSGLCRLNTGGESCRPLVIIKKDKPTTDGGETENPSRDKLDFSVLGN